MEEEIKKDQNTYQCKECLLHYKDRETVLQCEAWCKEHKTCNVEITRNAEENRTSSFAKASTFNKSSADKSEDELSELKKKCNEYLNNWKRAQADFENYKKNEFERATMLMGYAKEQIISQILPVLDNLNLAEKLLPEELMINEYVKGFLQVKKQIEDLLIGEGIEFIETSHKQFDPEFMEAIGEVEDGKSGWVAEEVQRGYKIGNKVIRPAKVKVGK